MAGIDQAEPPLLPILRRLIAEQGPITVTAYMTLALGHPRHGYYTTRDPFGARGDFTTAPEISQLFGEALAVWTALAWAAMGSPAPVNLVELGPGRGTLMADVTRTLARIAPDLAAAAHIHLVETSPVLQAKQKSLLSPSSSRPERARSEAEGSRSGGIAVARAGDPSTRAPTQGVAALGRDDAAERDENRIAWHETFSTVPPGPMMLLANEFFDALPIRQFVRSGGAWRERLVDWDESANRLIFRAGPPLPGAVLPALADAADGAVYEINPAATALAEEIGGRLAAAPGAALAIDYGRATTAAGDTLAAIQGGRKDADPLAAPGEADLTAHVDFEALAAGFAKGGAQSWTPVTQGHLLRALGIEERLAALSKRADTAEAAALTEGARRLIAPGGMGTIFRALAATSPGLPPPTGFA